jgi:Bacterial Ig-like domain (group 3)/FG-GAP-like repeat
MQPRGHPSLLSKYAKSLWIVTVCALSQTHVFASTATTTQLSLSASSIPSGSVLTLTASVSNGSPVKTGLVTFCDATASYCEDAALIGISQLTSAGTAVLRMVPGNGNHSYKAMFNRTVSNAASTSSIQSVTVTGTNATTTTIASSGSAGNYTLAGTVVGTGNGTLPQNGSLFFYDTTIGYTVATITPGVATPVYTFGSPTAFATGNTPKLAATGDFNGDGYADLAVTNSASNTVSILLGNGDGSFRSQSTYPVGNDPVAIAVGDFNQDGKADLVVSNYNSNSVSVLLGHGDGTFASQVTYATGNNPQSVAIGDFTADGTEDLAVENKTDKTLSIFLGNSNGTFQSQVTVSPGGTPFGLAIADLNGDGNDDIVMTNSGSATITVIIENGTGGALAAHTYAVGTTPYYAAVGDFNGDGKPDLAIVNYGSATLSVLLGNGDGTFQSQVTYPVGHNPNFVAVGDFNGDGKDDLATTNSSDNTASVLLGNGNGTFQAQSVYATGTSPQSITIKDFNGDGKEDVAISNGGSNNITVLLTSVTQTVTYTGSGVSIPGTGTHQVKAGYAGDATFSGSTSATIPLTAVPATTSVALTATPASSTIGQSVTLTASLNPYSAGSLTTNGESVTFLNGATSLGTGTLNAGTASLTLTTLPLGTNSLTSTFAADTNFKASTSSTLSFTVSKITPVITWAAAPTISYGTALSSTQLNATSGGVAGALVYVPSAGTLLTAGTNPLSVTFTPSNITNYFVVSATNSITVTQSASSILMASSLSPAAYGSPVTFTASLPFLATGIVTFKDGSTLLGSATITAGSAALSNQVLAVGSHSITASWPGDNNYTSSASVPLGQTVSRAAVTITATSSLNPSYYGDLVNLKYAVAGPGIIPTGTLTLMDGSATVATLTLDATGSASYVMQNASAGSHILLATYSGNASYF